jgi:hypothetical protein
MGKLTQEVMNAANQVDCKVSILSHPMLESLRVCLSEQFTDGNQGSPMWERFVKDVSIQDANAWTWLGEFTENNSVIMFFDKEQDTSGILFEKGTCLVPVLRECTGFEFYLTNQEGDYIICFNHHDFLIGVGSAFNWIEGKHHNS